MVSAPMEVGEGAFAVRVVGDAMLPLYSEGDMVIVRPSEVRSGGDFFVRLFAGEETTFRRVYLERGKEGEETARLQPVNPARRARVVATGAISGAWEATYVLRRAGGDVTGGAGRGW
jgi:SOS-response transcriptional repressor LexA